MPGCVTKRQVLAILAIYAVTRGVIDALKPVDEDSAESSAFDKVAFDATMNAATEKAKSLTEGGK
jgi:hypothetical protein